MLRWDLIVKTCAVPQLIRALPRRRVRRDQVTHRPIDRSDEPGPARVDGEICSAGKHALEPPTFNPREVAEELGDRVCIGVRTPAALIGGQIRCETNHLESLKREHQLQHVGFGSSLHSPNIGTPTRPVKPITPPKRARRVDRPAIGDGQSFSHPSGRSGGSRSCGGSTRTHDWSSKGHLRWTRSSTADAAAEWIARASSAVNSPTSTAKASSSASFSCQSVRS